MSSEKKTGGVSNLTSERARMAAEDGLEPELDKALREYRSSVLGWSAAVYSRPRGMVAAAGRRQLWRLTAGWALGCALLVGFVFAGVYQHHRLVGTVARIDAPVRQVTVPRNQPAQQKVQRTRREDEELLAKVDSDVSQAVPSAMEPLAQLMAGEETR
ncbi:MAG: hypothetical protein ABR906_09065 [Terracidiphilus sp.]|jgi:hypothetical protein